MCTVIKDSMFSLNHISLSMFYKPYLVTVYIMYTTITVLMYGRTVIIFANK